ncbi:porin [Burkholderia sp. MSMB1552]|nr:MULTISPECIES: porin [unclassified Burkholderia]KVN12704.1 porin [Burkholderia sp. MSMB1552]KWZ49450.1 porin [Burkholderia sp. MSMB1588]
MCERGYLTLPDSYRQIARLLVPELTRRGRYPVAGVPGSFREKLFGLAWSHTQLDYVDGSSRKFNNYDVNGRYQITPAATLIGVYTFTNGRASGLPGTGGQTLKPRWRQFTLGFDYALSKRTDIYLSGIYQLAAGDANTATSGGYRKIAAISNIGTASSTNRQAALVSGLRVKC